mgnify:CR=1 FL=1
MKPVLITFILCVLACLFGRAQPAVTRDRVPSLTLGEGTTLHILSPEPIQYVDVPAGRISGDLALPKVLRIKAIPDTTGSNRLSENDLGLITIIGETFLAQYNLRWNPFAPWSSGVARITIPPKDRRPLPGSADHLSEAELHRLCLQAIHLSNRRSGPVARARSADIDFRLNAIYTDGQRLYLDITLRNHTNLDYDPDGLHLSVDDRRVTRATNVQSVPVEPRWQLYPLTSFRGTYRTVLVLDKLTFPEQKVLTLRLTEQQLSGRTVTLKVKYKALLNAEWIGPDRG